ncbi:hypothetical protein AGOR_G00153850 [Albula goreensis]|uniref:SRCR domain-containing protein n=1 Tax=Albula goreensis TaxID=1534307 RepID=A0A8T3D365_9TELE|nr:hypothetical protein AGOR_G00153850 [Albula goreensis]
MEVFYSYHTYTTTLSLPVVAIAEEAPVRLVSRFQGSHCAGRLEMLVQSDWAPVCRGTSDTAVGRVVCRELGCGILLSAGYARASTTQQVRNSVGKVECSGEEAKLQECSIALQRCPTRELKEIVCSDFLPPPKLSVSGYGDVSDVYVHVESPLEISCTVNEERLRGEQIVIDLVNAKTRNSYGSKFLSSVEPTTFKLSAPVTPGQYACYATFHGFQQTAKSTLSNTVDITTGTWYPPSAGLIVGALSAILLGAGILVYICIGRVSKGESQDNATPQEEQPEDSITSSQAGMDNPATIPELNTEISATPPGGSAENPTTTR